MPAENFSPMGNVFKGNQSANTKSIPEVADFSKPSSLLIRANQLLTDHIVGESVGKPNSVVYIQSPETMEDAQKLRETLVAKGYTDMGNNYIGRDEEEKVRNIQNKPISRSHEKMINPLPTIEKIDSSGEKPLYIVCEGYYENDGKLVKVLGYKRIFKLETY